MLPPARKALSIIEDYYAVREPAVRSIPNADASSNTEPPASCRPASEASAFGDCSRDRPGLRTITASTLVN
jgi:hypothetical protein